MGRGTGTLSAAGLSATRVSRRSKSFVQHITPQANKSYQQKPETTSDFLGPVFKDKDNYSLFPEGYFDYEWWNAYEERTDADKDGWLLGWTKAHSLDPSDSTMIYYELRDHPVFKWCERFTAKLIHQNKLPFKEHRIYPAHLDADACLWKPEYGEKPEAFLGGYMPSTGLRQAPVIYVNLEAHLDKETIHNEKALKKALKETIKHEMRHAYQDYLHISLDEDQAESGDKRIPF